jgi:hypothetical protein
VIGYEFGSDLGVALAGIDHVVRRAFVDRAHGWFYVLMKCLVVSAHGGRKARNE